MTKTRFNTKSKQENPNPAIIRKEGVRVQIGGPMETAALRVKEDMMIDSHLSRECIL